MDALGMTVSIKLDHNQFDALMDRLDGLEDRMRVMQNLILKSVDDPKKLAALTELLKKSSDKLKDTVARNQST